MALQTMYINATEVWCYRGGWKSDIARFGTASGGHYTDSQIKFTPSVEDLAKLRNARITSVTASLTFAKLGSSGTKTIRFGFSRGDNYWITVTNAYNQVRWPSIWTGNSLDDSSNWGARFLAQLKDNSSVTIYIENNEMDVPSGKNYASNYGGIKLPSYLTVIYEPLSSELEISDGQSFDLGALNNVSLVRYVSDYSERAFLDYEGNPLEPLELKDSSPDDTSKFSFTLPLKIANNITDRSIVPGTINLKTYNNDEEQIGEEKIYNIQITIPPNIFFSKGDNWKIEGVSDINGIESEYFIQDLSRAQITCNFKQYKNEDEEFTDEATITSCIIENSKLGISEKMDEENNNTFTYTTSSTLKVAGDISFNIIVENSRGHKKIFQTETFSIQSYSIPQITDISVIRINETGAPVEVGNFLKWSGILKYSNVIYSNSGINVPVSLTLYYSNTSKTFTVTSDDLNNNIGNFSVNLIDTSVEGGLFSTDKSYEIKAIVQDSFGNQSIERTATLSTTKYLIHFSNGGGALGLGSAAIHDQKITCGFDMFFKSNSGALKITEGGTEAIDREGAWNNIVKPGGDIGSLNESRVLNIYDSLSIFGKNNNDGSGSSGRIRFYDVGENTTYYGDLEKTVQRPMSAFFTKAFNSSGTRVNKIQFMQSSPSNSDQNLHAGGYEVYSFPEVTHGLESEIYKHYKIFTEKDYLDILYTNNTHSTIKRIIIKTKMDFAYSNTININMPLTNFKTIVGFSGFLCSDSTVTYPNSSYPNAPAGIRPGYGRPVPSGWILDSSNSWSIGVWYSPQENVFKIGFPSAYSATSEWNNIRNSTLYLTVDYIL